MSTTYPPGMGRGWQTTTFRWLSIYAVIFAVSVIGLVAAIEWSVSSSLKLTLDGTMRWQIIYFDSISETNLPSTIHRRLEHERMHSNYYGLFSPDGGHIAGDILSAPPNLKTDGNGFTVQSLRLIHGLQSPIVRVMAVKRDEGDTLVIARDLSSVVSTRRVLNRTLAAGAFVCVFLGISGGLLISYRQLRRVRDIRRVTLQIARGDLNQRLPIGQGNDELAMLSHLVNHMLAEVERFMHEVKGACDGIAHDLRTPLAHVRTLLGNIEERRTHIDDAPSLEMLSQAKLETETLLARFRAMLRISEIGALQRRGGFAALDLGELVQDLFELYEPLAEETGVVLMLNREAVTPINGDRALLFEAFSNLLDNAIKFSPNEGKVRISLEMANQGPKVIISDQGPGIAPAERQAVRQRFYRANGTRHLPGIGLGLSIVSAVIRVHDFELHIGSAEPGAIMTLECWAHAFTHDVI